MADPLQLLFRRPMDEQVAAFRLRLQNLVPTAKWDDISGQAHDRAGMVAGALKADLIADILGAVDRSIVEGTGLEAFRRDFKSIVAKHGWSGWTGQGTEKGEAWRTKVIWKTNVSTSYAAGRWAQLRAKGFKYLVYRHSGAEHPRHDHLSWDGLILPIDHPFWLSHFPPNGWGCGCSVRGAMSIEMAKRLGGKPEKSLPDDWAALDPKTGAPKGIDKGWDHAPGATVAETISALTAKPMNWEFSVARAYMRDVPAPHRDAFAQGYRGLPSVATDMRRYVERVRGERNGASIAPDITVEPQRTLGLATSKQVQEIGQLTGTSIAADLYDYTVDQDAVRHIFSRHSDAKIEASRGQRAILSEDFERLGPLINAPDSIGMSAQVPNRGPRIVLTKQFGNERLVALFELRTGRRRLSLVTMWVEKIAGASPTITP